MVVLWFVVLFPFLCEVLEQPRLCGMPREACPTLDVRLDAGRLPHKSSRGSLQAAVLDRIGRCREADLPDSRGRTALHVAARKGLSELVPLILGARGNPDARDGDGWTALHHAVFNGHTETVRPTVARRVVV